MNAACGVGASIKKFPTVQKLSLVKSFQEMEVSCDQRNVLAVQWGSEIWTGPDFEWVPES